MLKDSSEALAYIHSVYWRGSKLGLVRIRELLRLMGNPQDSLRFVHVAGTNGKGSVCAMLSAIFQAQGYQTGMYTSPYIEHFNERIQVNSRSIPDADLRAVTEYVKNFAESMADLPTEFELVCAIAFEYFRRRRCDIVVLEVGLGGWLDATNIISSPLAAVITPIDYDHMAYLGDTITAIAGEKCGIIKPGCSAVTAVQRPEAFAVISARCRETTVPLAVCDLSAIKSIIDNLNGQIWNYKKFHNLHLSLLGSYQLENAALAIEAALALRAKGIEIGDNAIQNGLAAARWPARFEVLNRDPLLILDGAHNPHGVRAAVEAAKKYLAGREVLVLVGFLADKDYPPMLAVLNEIAARYIATAPNDPRALAAGTLAGALAGFGKPIDIVPGVSDAVPLAINLAQSGGHAVLAIGSLYMAGEIRGLFMEDSDIELPH